MNIKRRFTILLLVLSVLLVGVLTIGAQETPTFFIGVLDTPTGTVTRGARLAVDSINSAGGVRGADGVDYQLQLVVEPTNFGEGLESAVNNLNQADVIAILAPASNEEVLNGLTILQSLNVPVLTPATDDTLLITADSDSVFRTRAAEAQSGQALANYIINEFGLREIIVVQLDIASTASVVGFTSAAEALDAPPGSALLRDPQQVTNLAQQLVEADTDVLVTFGSPALAGTLYRDLRVGGWEGLFVYNQADDTNFKTFIPDDQLEGIVSANTWSFARIDVASNTFLNRFIRSFGVIPGAVEAASYDAVLMVANALQQPGNLTDNLRAIDGLEGVQGTLNPANLGSGETSNNVVITRLGQYGAPEVLARYAGAVLLPPDVPTLPGNVETGVTATPTPDGVTISIRGSVQNVRSGPGLDFTILGQLRQGETARVIGALADNSWVIIDYRGQQGWLATYLLDVSGDLNSVPLITPPPTPTPLPPTATPTRSPEPDLVIDAAIVIPSPIVPGQPFNVAVTVRNAGLSVTGTFVVSANLPPNNILVTAIVPGLAPNQSFVANMQGILTNTGYYSATIIIDSNNQVFEGANGEINNAFIFNYAIDKSVQRSAGQTLNLGDTIDLEGNAVQGDANWNTDSGIELDALNGAKLGIIPGTDINITHYDLINPASINRDSIPRTELVVGSLIGIITADGNRGVMRVDAITDTQIALAFKLYNN